MPWLPGSIIERVMRSVSSGLLPVFMCIVSTRRKGLLFGSESKRMMSLRIVNCKEKGKYGDVRRGKLVLEVIRKDSPEEVLFEGYIMCADFKGINALFLRKIKET